MKALRNLLDKLAPNFEHGGKWEKLYPLYEAGDTFLFTPGEVAKTNSHVRDAIDLKRMMSMVIVALLPCIYMALYNTGYQTNLHIDEVPDTWRGTVLNMLGCGVDAGNWFDCMVHGALYFLPVYIVTMAVGGAWEGLFAMVRGHEINEGFLVTGMLFPLTLPPTIPWWQVALGISFGVVIGKEIFGGTGRNFLNPALTARAFLYFAYPAQISGEKVWTAPVDGFSGATPLGAGASGGMDAIYESGITFGDAFLGTIQGSMGETSTLACLIGAIILILTGIGSWRIMLSVVLGALALSSALFLIGSESNRMFDMNPIWHLAVGGFAFGTVFMATDPVSASMTERGKWFYGFLIGAMTILIRVINPAFPEGIMLAILFGNVFAPLIDYFVIQANIKRRLARNAA
ncbi:MAG: NADH:ubiquinone reductase (Na(+)-transporting) subunit B [Planctomycetaceae bacterium]|nr:NADH:ubiquinone reductase (Na(+)-transporting) subunit B [Planctomycetaceae bacterium]